MLAKAGLRAACRGTGSRQRMLGRCSWWRVMLDVCKESKVLLDLFRELRNAAEALGADFSASCCVEKPPSFRSDYLGPGYGISVGQGRRRSAAQVTARQGCAGAAQTHGRTARVDAACRPPPATRHRTPAQQSQHTLRCPCPAPPRLRTASYRCTHSTRRRRPPATARGARRRNRQSRPARRAPPPRLPALTAPAPLSQCSPTRSTLAAAAAAEAAHATPAPASPAIAALSGGCAARRARRRRPGARRGTGCNPACPACRVQQGVSPRATAAASIGVIDLCEQGSALRHTKPPPCLWLRCS